MSGRLIETLLFGVRPLDPATFACHRRAGHHRRAVDRRTGLAGRADRPGGRASQRVSVEGQCADTAHQSMMPVFGRRHSEGCPWTPSPRRHADSSSPRRPPPRPRSPSCPRHVLGGPRFVAPERQGERRDHRRRRPGPDQRARASSRKTTARSSRLRTRPRSGTSRSWYYGGKAGRGPVQARRSRSTTRARRRTTSARSTRISG